MHPGRLMDMTSLRVHRCCRWPGFSPDVDEFAGKTLPEAMVSTLKSQEFQVSSITSQKSMHAALRLPLVCYLQRLSICTDCHVCRRLLCRDCKLLVVEFGERHVPDRHVADFLEAFILLEYGCKVVLGDVVGNVLEEEDLVRPYVFVGNNCSASLLSTWFLSGNRVGLRFRVFFCSLKVC